jgi:hypothetical protein
MMNHGKETNVTTLLYNRSSVQNKSNNYIAKRQRSSNPKLTGRRRPRPLTNSSQHPPCASSCGTVRLEMMILTAWARNTATTSSKCVNGASEREGEIYADRATPPARGYGRGRKGWHLGPTRRRKRSGGCNGADGADGSRV